MRKMRTRMALGTTLDQVRDENNDLFKKVRWTRELVLDADNVDVLATKYAKQVEQKVQVRGVVASFESVDRSHSYFLLY
jgi:hypothetical protein